ncbi:MAG: NADH-quinone oxidoreductase subunit N [Planctomycetia bacterium]|nr:NADH-quinone oxidoreductase subunit N [Planctomycetia bacterium]
MDPNAAYTSAAGVLQLIPEMIVVGGAVFVFVGGTFAKSKTAWSWVAAAGLAAAGLALWTQKVPGGFAGPIAVDALGYTLRWLVLLLGGVFVLALARPAAAGQAPEVTGSLLLAIAGGMIVSVSGELVLLFVALETISIPTYVLLYVGRKDSASQESAAKYFFLSILSSAVTLYGFCFLYGVTGSTHLAEIARVLQNTSVAAVADWGPLPDLALVLIFVGLAFKIAAAPFHFYAPDVYQGTTHENAMLLAVLPKVAGIAALIRVTTLAMPLAAGTGWRIALFLAVVTMTVGNMTALWQKNVRRLLAYSSIAHAGYLLIGLAAGFAATLGPQGSRPEEGLGASVFYLVVYAFSTAGAFAALAYLGSPERQVDTVAELAGLGRTRPVSAAALAVFMFSLAGVPPLAGFWGKLSLFLSALDVRSSPGLGASRQTWFIVLAVIGALNAAVAATYYLRVVATMYFLPPAKEPRAEGGGAVRTAGGLCLVAVLLIGLLLGPMLIQATQDAVQASAPVPPPKPAQQAQIDGAPPSIVR